MATSTTETSKTTASVESLKMSSKNPSICSSKRAASTESVLSEKKRENALMKGSKKDLAVDKKETKVLIKEEGVARSPPVKKITSAPPNANPDVCFEVSSHF